MICYASRTGTARNLAALRVAGWRLLVSRTGVWRTEGFQNYALDNGAWTDFQQERPFDEREFMRLLDRLAAKADWVVLPDIVAGGRTSLDLSLRWRERALKRCKLALLAVQDGMVPADVAPFVGPRVGIFLGGSTPWKLATMEAWGQLAAASGAHYHVARVNTERRLALAVASGAASVDGSSGSRFACTIPRLARAATHRDLFAFQARAA